MFFDNFAHPRHQNRHRTSFGDMSFFFFFHFVGQLFSKVRQSLVKTGLELNFFQQTIFKI